MPSMSSWGANGYGEVWLNGTNVWIYRHLHKAAERMIELAHNYYNETGLYERALNQAARELLLAQSSDWAFIMHTGTMVEYAVNTTKLYLKRFTDLYYANKKTNYMNEKGEFVEVTEPNAYKFEAFIFDAFNFFDDMSILRGRREEDFAPVKNKEGNDSPNTAKELYNNYWRK